MERGIKIEMLKFIVNAFSVDLGLKDVGDHDIWNKRYISR